MEQKANPYEPKRKNKSVTDFHVQLGIKEWMVNSVDKPKLVEDSSGHDHFHWADMRVELIDPVNHSPISELYELKDNPFKLNTFHVRNVNAIGEILEEWEVKPERITSVDFGGRVSNDDGDDIQKLSIHIRPEYCELKKS